jgi:hypothetical protein
MILWKNFHQDASWVWTRSSQTRFTKWSGREINVNSFFNPNGFAIVDILPEWDRVVA